jgi:DNA-binding transcriptional regulator YiaG
MQKKPKVPRAPHRVADEIMSGLREIERMLDEGKNPEEMFTVRTVVIPAPRRYHGREVRLLRETLGVSQAVFSHLLGVSLVLVKSWERDARIPNAMACRLLDTIKSDPNRWLADVRKTAV